MIGFRRGVSCEVSAFEVPNPPLEPESPQRKWLAIATAHVYDPDFEVRGLTRQQVALAGEMMRVVEGRAMGDTEAEALVAALNALLFQLAARGYSTDEDVRLLK